MQLKKRIYVDMDDVLCDFRGTLRKARATEPDFKYPQAKIDFFRNLPPLEGAIESYKELSAMDCFDVYILTAPSLKNPSSYTEKRIWVEAYLGERYVDRLIISPDKSLLIGDYLIDDITFGRGQERFGGYLVHFGSDKFPNWEIVMNYFSDIANNFK